MNGFAAVWADRAMFLPGLANTASLALACALLSFPLGCLGAMALIEAPRPLRRLGRECLDVLRCVPFLLLAYVVYFGLPELGLSFDAWCAGLVTLVIYNTHYLVEIIRSAAAAIPADHVEASNAFGFTRFGLYRRIILPQVLVNAAPVIGNQFIMMIKDTALLMIITVQELSFAANFVNAQAFSPFVPFAVAVAFYWALCLLVEWGVRQLSAIRRMRFG